MKKKLLSLAVASLVCSGVAEAKFYLGVEGGYNGSLSTFLSEDNGLTPSNSKLELREHGAVGNLVLGTEHFFGKQYFGLRWGLFLGYGSAWGKIGDFKTQLDNMSMGASFDLFVNFVAKENFMSGIFAGIEYDYTFLFPKDEIKIGNTYQNIDYYVGNKTMFDSVALRVGFSTKIAKHHRLEIMAKVPVLSPEHVAHYSYTETFNGQITKKIDDKFTFRYQYIQGLASYKYVF